MRRIGNTIIRIGAAAAVMAALCAWPAAASDPSSVANETIKPSAAMAWAPKSKASRPGQGRSHPARLAVLASQYCGWRGSPCQRPVVLILGIGF